MKRLFIIAAIAAAIGLFVRYQLFEIGLIASASMEPALKIGQKVVINKLVYVASFPKRGDIIDFVSPVDSGKELIKRVIGLPGDTIEIVNKEVVLNGSPLDEKYVRHSRMNECLAGDNIGPLKVPDNHLFVMGDNRDESGDSRDWKDPVTKEQMCFISMKAVKGKITHTVK